MFLSPRRVDAIVPPMLRSGRSACAPRCLLVLALTFDTSAAAAAAARPDDTDASWYMALLERYAAGDTDAAVRGVLDADPERLEVAHKESFDAVDRAMTPMSQRDPVHANNPSTRDSL